MAVAATAAVFLSTSIAVAIVLALTTIVFAVPGPIDAVRFPVCADVAAFTNAANVISFADATDSTNGIDPAAMGYAADSGELNDIGRPGGSAAA